MDFSPHFIGCKEKSGKTVRFSRGVLFSHFFTYKLYWIVRTEPDKKENTVEGEGGGSYFFPSWLERKGKGGVGDSVWLVLREAVTLPCCVREYSCCSELHTGGNYILTGMTRGWGRELLSSSLPCSSLSCSSLFCSSIFCSSLFCSAAYRFPARYMYTAARIMKSVVVRDAIAQVFGYCCLLFPGRLQHISEGRGRMGRY